VHNSSSVFTKTRIRVENNTGEPNLEVNDNENDGVNYVSRGDKAFIYSLLHADGTSNRCGKHFSYS